ncbi:MAG: AbrB/MazE/SpoVT family DNA-binding domain-containing protein [Thermoprotei archaeon]|nr:MAG: AbrB/MazE/SpoVT family DNA-binding domain-containing protein [Thermoprotei archaeon]
MGKMYVVLDDRGRVLIPSEIRKLLGLRGGSKLAVRVEAGRIILEKQPPRTKKVRAGRRWGREAFLDAGEATFAD